MSDDDVMCIIRKVGSQLTSFTLDGEDLTDVFSYLLVSRREQYHKQCELREITHHFHQSETQSSGGNLPPRALRIIEQVRPLLVVETNYQKRLLLNRDIHLRVMSGLSLIF
ncbi:hypothetical protein L798_14500 [Zootermopsis nevadensis]|uniref:Uncharacterized protein n=1 Tax=Zootermopsis nevadensis TaxID=136037 RepID=A0A067RID7_ZOONE|nr:hypothetical protein L798_14500 [Zootermopsis nevadensis]